MENKQDVISLLFLQAVSMPQAFDNAWSAVGGGPPDLVFPDNFLGHWLTESTLSKIETPLGLEFIPNPLVSCRNRSLHLIPLGYGCRYSSCGATWCSLHLRF